MQAERNRFHNYSVRYNRLIKKFENDETISEKNKALLRRYLDSLFADGLSLPRIIKHFWEIYMLTKWLGKNWEEANRDDIEQLIAKIRRMNYAESTFCDFKVAIKRFFKWFKGANLGYPPEVSWIKTTLKKNRYKLPEEMLTEDDVKKIIDACEHPRDKALCALLWETGARIGEIGNARIKSVEFANGEGWITLQGKTGMRRVLLISSVPYLRQWLSIHPQRDNPEAPLFVMIGTRNRGKAITYASVTRLLRKVMKKAGIKKRCNPHLWRHSRATYLAKYLTEAQLCSVMGWVIGSKEARTYVHLSQRDVEESIKRIYGLTKKEEEKPSQFIPIKCPICGEINEPNAKICMRCNNPLTPEGYAEKLQQASYQAEKQKTLQEIMQKLAITIELLIRKVESYENRLSKLEKEKYPELIR